MIDRRCVCRFLCCSLAAASMGASKQAEYFGVYLDDLHVKLLEDGQRVMLLRDFRYRDRDDLVWVAQEGEISDGASIPRTFWSFVGGPLNGKYRSASIIHDSYCNKRTRGWRETHRVFYRGMRSSGVPPPLASSMYYAVLVGGPRWNTKNTSVSPQYTPDELKDILQRIKHISTTPNVSADQVEAEAIAYSAAKFPEELR